MKTKFGYLKSVTGKDVIIPEIGGSMPLAIIIANKLVNSESKEKEKSYNRYALAMKLGALEVDEEVELSEAEITMIEEALKEGGLTILQAVQIYKAIGK